MTLIRHTKLGKLLKQYRIEHWVDNNTIYRQVTITKDGHVFLRGTKPGSEIGRKRQFVIDLEKHPNTLLFIRQTIWDGGIGLASPEVHGCIVTENFPMFEIVGEVEPLFLLNFFRSVGFYKQLSQIRTTGSAQKAIHERDFLDIEIPLPDLDTQKSIVSRLRELQALHAQANATLARLQADVKRLRQSILQQAIQGKLVDNTLPPGEKTGAELLADIRAEKERRAREQGKKPDKPLPPVTEKEMPFELPEGWVWCRLGDLGEATTGTTPPTDNAEFFGNEYPFIKPADITNEKIYYSEEGLSKKGMEYGRPIRPNSILMVCIGGSIGKCYFVERLCSCNQQINVLGLPSFVPAQFVLVLLQSTYFQEKIWDKASGGTTPIVNKSKWESILLPLPPPKLIELIMSRVSLSSSEIKKIEALISKLSYSLSHLWQSEMQQIFKFESNGEASN